jgi:hypothetical protein
MNPTIPRDWAALCFGAAALAALSLPAYAGTYSTDFTTDPTDPSLPANQRLTIFSNQAVGSALRPGWVATDGNPGGYFRLTDAVGNIRSTIVFPDFEAGFAVAGFKFSVDARIGAGSATPADGFSINFAKSSDPVITTGEGYAGNAHEEGTTTGLGIGFDSYNNGGGDVIGLVIRVDGNILTEVPLPTLNGSVTDATSIQTGPNGQGIGALGWAKFEVEIDPATTELSVTWKGVKLIDKLDTGFRPSPGRLVFGARTGGSNQAHHFDNLSLETFVYPLAVVNSATLVDNQFTFQITDFGTQSIVTPATADLQLIIGNDLVTPTSVTKANGITTITYTPPQPLPLNAPYNYSLSAVDNRGEEVFRAGTLRTPILPTASLIADTPTLNQWNIREIRGATVGGTPPLNTAVQIAQANTVTADPIRVENYTAPYFNLTDDNNGGSRGLFKRDAFFRTNNYLNAPGVTTAVDDNNIVGLGKTLITVPETGTYTFWVQSDDGFALRVNGATFTRVVGTAGTVNGLPAALIDPADPSTMAFQLGTGNANTRGSVTLTAGVEYVIDFLWFEGSGGAFAEVTWAKGDFVDTPANGAFRLLGGAGQTPIFPADPLPLQVPTGTTNSWAVRDIRPTPGGTTLRQAIALAFNPGALTVTDKTSPVINFADPEGPGAPGMFLTNMPYPNNTPSAEDQFLTIATYEFEAAPGDYSFAIASDDGFAFRIIGGPPGGVHGINNGGAGIAVHTAVHPADTLSGAGFDPLDPTTFYNPTWTNDNYAVYRVLTAGTYKIELVTFENTGGSGLEVAWAAGNHASRGSTSAWQLLGNNSDPTVPAQIPYFASNLFEGMPLAPAGLWSVKFAYSTTAITNLDLGIAAVRNANVPSHTGTVPYLNYRNFVAEGLTEPTTGSGLFWSGNTNTIYRVPTENQYLGATGLVDNVGAFATSRIVIPTTGDYTFGINSDDGFMLRILGATPGFSRVSGSAVIDPAQKNTVYRLTGSNNARAVINLQAGSYDVEFAYYEGTGGAHFELYAVAGNITNDADTTNWRIVGHTDSGGLALQAQQPPTPVVINVGTPTVNATTGAYSFSWNSSPSATYQIQYSLDMINWSNVEAAFPGAQGNSTTYSGNANDLAPVGPKTKVFFRMKQN